MPRLTYTPFRHRSGYTMIEIALVLVFIGLLAALAIPKLTDATTASTLRETQEGIEQVSWAEQQVYLSTGSHDVTPGSLNAWAPSAVIVDGATVSLTPGEVSVAVDGSTVAFASTDGNGWCWFKLRAYGAQQPDLPEVHALSDTMTCTGVAALTYSSTQPPAGDGSRWTDPWELS